MQGVYSLKKRLGQSEWDVILGYARRVRALPRLRGSLGLSADCVEALSKPPTTIFPNLRVVQLHCPKPAIAPFVRHLTSPRLTELSLSLTESIGAAIDTFGEQCPSVTDFHVTGLANADTISRLLYRWQNLSSVDCYNVGLNVDILAHLSRSRNLSDLVLELRSAGLDRPQLTHSSPPTLTFLALRGLRLHSASLIPVWRLFHHLRIPKIHKLYLDLYTPPTASDLASFFVALQEACTHDTLSSFLVRVYESVHWPSLPSLPPHHITFDCLCPLTAFVNITSIILDIPCGVDLNEREFLSLASSWPHLERFEVGKDYDWTASSAITPGGFLQLLERCRSLRVLYIMFDTRGFTEIPQGHPWRGLTMPKNTSIHLLNSPIEKESIEALGVFFHVAPYPEFDLTTHWSNRYFKGSQRPQELCDVYYDRWVDVRALSLNLWEQRRDLRRSLETRFSQHHL